MKTIAIIPARGGSKRLPNKNVLSLGGLPLLVHSIKYALEQPEIDSVIVTTDDEHIKQIALEHGAEVIDRPKHLSGDLAPTISALQHVLEHTENDINTIVLLQATNPLRPKGLFKKAFTLFNSQNCDSLFTVSPNHDKLGKIIDNIFLPFNYIPGQRSQDLEHLYCENGLLYITKTRTIKAGFIITENAFPLVVDHPYTKVDIDTQEDFDYAEFLLNRSRRK